MLEAHVDELAFMITEVMADGFLRFSPVGYYNTLCLECQDVVIYGKKEVPGVICARPDKPQDAKKHHQPAHGLALYRYRPFSRRGKGTHSAG